MTSAAPPLTADMTIPLSTADLERHPAYERVRHHVQQQLCTAAFSGNLPQPVATIDDVIRDELGNTSQLANNTEFMAQVVERLLQRSANN